MRRYRGCWTLEARLRNFQLRYLADAEPRSKRAGQAPARPPCYWRLCCSGYGLPSPTPRRPLQTRPLESPPSLLSVPSTWAPSASTSSAPTSSGRTMRRARSMLLRMIFTRRSSTASRNWALPACATRAAQTPTVSTGSGHRSSAGPARQRALRHAVHPHLGHLLRPGRSGHICGRPGRVRPLAQRNRRHRQHQSSTSLRAPPRRQPILWPI